MYHDLREVFWWDGLKKDIAEFVAKCRYYQHMKAEHQNPDGLLQEIQVLTWKWEDINTDFVVGLPRTQKQYDSIWVVVDRFTKSAHLIPVESTYSVEDYAKIFIDGIMCRHGNSLSIISNWGAQFTYRFSRSSQKGLVPR